MPRITAPPIISIDPGRVKCGVAVVNSDNSVIDKNIVNTESLNSAVSYLVGKFGSNTVILGDRTYSKNVYSMLKSSGLRLDIIFVDEDKSSEQGRRRYLMDNKPKGLGILLPIGLRSPDKPYDDYVAIILAERYFDGIRSTRRRKK